jgi:hypothetical protein
MDDLEFYKFFIREAKKWLRKPEVILRRRSLEMAQQRQKNLTYLASMQFNAIQ